MDRSEQVGLMGDMKENKQGGHSSSEYQEQMLQLKNVRETFLYRDDGSNIQQPFYSFAESIQNNRMTNNPQFFKQQGVQQAEMRQQRNQVRENIFQNGQLEQEQMSNKIDKEVEAKIEQKSGDMQQYEKQLAKIPSQLIKQCKQIATKLIQKIELNQYRQCLQQKMSPIYTQFCRCFSNLQTNTQIQQSINTYAQILVKYWNDQMFFQHFVENKYLSLLMFKIREHKYAPDIVKAVFGCLEYLLKGLGSESCNSNSCNKQEQFIYLLVMINREGFISQKYKFSESDDWAYYAHFMKLLVRIINQADKAQQISIRKSLAQSQKQQNQDQISQTVSFSAVKNQVHSNILNSNRSLEFQQLYSKYLTIFFNNKTPQFPLLLKLLYFYKWPDTILQTSIKLCLLQISNHPNRMLQQYLLNFPFITFYMLYCTKISENIQKYLQHSSTRTPTCPQSCQQQSLAQQIISDIKFMQDFLKIESQQQPLQLQLSQSQLSQLSKQKQQNGSYRNCNPKQNHIQEHLNVYINCFMYYVGRGLYQSLCKFALDQNVNGIVNGMLLLVKIVAINTVLKVKLGFQEMFHQYVNCGLWAYLRAKRQKLDSDKYWIFDQCEGQIRQHSQTILFSQQHKIQPPSSRKSNRALYQSEMIQAIQLPSQIGVTKSSLGSNKQRNKKQASYSSMVFNVFRSYIPTTNYSWLHYEMKKISQAIGLQVTLNKPIDHYSEMSASNSSYYKESFLCIIDKIQQYHYNGNNSMVMKSKTSLLSRFSSPIRLNPLFTTIINMANKGGLKHSNSGSKSDSEGGSGKKIYEDSSEQLIYYYLVLMCSLKDQKNGNNAANNKQDNNTSLEELCDLLKITKRCKSLMLVGMMYWYVKVLDYQLKEGSVDLSICQEGYHMVQKDRKKQKQRIGQKQGQSYQTLASQLLQNYLQVMQKLVYYILTQGWQTFSKHIQEIKKIIWNKKKSSHNPNSNGNANANANGNGKMEQKKNGTNINKQQNDGYQYYQYEDCNRNSVTQFTNDIFRDIQCDIVYFVTLRHLFGTRNTTQETVQHIDKFIEDRDIISKEIKVPCRLTNSQGDQVYLIMDGQYIKFITIDDIPISKKPISVNSFNIYTPDSQLQPQPSALIQKSAQNSPIKSQIKPKTHKKAVFELVDKTLNGECYTVYFEQIPIREYIAKEIKWRKKIILQIQMNLRTILFDIEY